jgi:ribosomal protein S18 acetylase RimI-like enzyme
MKMLEIEITPLAGDAEARACAEMMASSDPWVFFGRTFEQCLARVTNPGGEVWVAREDGIARGFIILVLQGAFVGYIQVVCVAAEARGSGLGSRLVRFAEERIFGSSPTCSFVSRQSTRAYGSCTNGSDTRWSASLTTTSCAATRNS